MTVFITGGCKNGKSTFAINLAAAIEPGLPHWYVATLIPRDAEGWECVRRHRQSREGMGFMTLEQPRDICSCFNEAGEKGVFLLDSLTALLMNVQSPEKAAEDVLAFIQRAEHAVIVSDYIYCDGLDYGEYSEGFRRGLACLDRLMAAECGHVAEIVGSVPVWHKGGIPWSL